MLSLIISEFFDKGGGLDVITSYHHFRVKGLFPASVIFLLNSFSREGNSVAASSSSLNVEVHPLDFLEECLNEGKGVQGFFRGLIVSPLLNYLECLCYYSVHGFLYLPVS